MSDDGIIEKHFFTTDKVVRALYDNGGVRVTGYGFMSGGYGGGIDQEQAHLLMWLDGYLRGLTIGNAREAHTLMAALNKRLMSTFPDEVNSANVPFINLTEAELPILEAGKRHLSTGETAHD